MSLPFNLQKLPPEALDVLRYLGRLSTGATTEDIEEGTGLASRPVGKAIRRLVTADYIHLGFQGYEVTTDGKIAIGQLAEYDAATGGGRASKSETPEPSIPRRLVVVVPGLLTAGQPADLLIGVNSPVGDNRLPETANLELKVRAMGGVLSADNISLEVPPDTAAKPGKISLTPAHPGQTVRVRIDAFQAFDFDQLEPVGGMYFDTQVAPDTAQKQGASRAVGIDLLLKPSRS